MTNKLINFFSVALGLLIISAPVFAHHGAAAYDMSKPATIKGKVVEFLFINPHCQLYVEVTDEKGNAVKWAGEFTIQRSAQAWLTKEMFKQGTRSLLSGIAPKRRDCNPCIESRLSDGRTLAALGPE